MRHCLFDRKSVQTVDPATPQLALFNETEGVVEVVAEATDEEVVAPTKCRGKYHPRLNDLPRIEVIHELSEHEPTCTCGCREDTIGRGQREARNCAYADPRD